MHCAAAAQDGTTSITDSSKARTAEATASHVAAFGAVGALAAEFGSSAQQALREAAVFAVADTAADQLKSDAVHAPPTSAAAAAAALMAANTVMVTEQHLLLAVLTTPGALQLIAQHMTVDRGSAAVEALQDILGNRCEGLQQSLTRFAAATADPACSTELSINFHLPPGMLAAMNRALHITRRLGEHATSL
jgi:hypothetical protein